jgi:hypothetical protein
MACPARFAELPFKLHLYTHASRLPPPNAPEVGDDDFGSTPGPYRGHGARRSRQPPGLLLTACRGHGVYTDQYIKGVSTLYLATPRQ